METVSSNLATNSIKVSVEEVEPKIKCYEFSTSFMDQSVIYFQLLHMDTCLYIWIGNERPSNSKHKYLSISLKSVCRIYTSRIGK